MLPAGPPGARSNFTERRRVAGEGPSGEVARRAALANVVALLGHGSTAMLHRHYAHLTAKAGVLRNAAALVRPAATTAIPATDGTAGPIPA
jgi:hypothetical protein